MRKGSRCALVASLLGSFGEAGCSTPCEGHASMTMVVGADEPCPSVAAAQRSYDQAQLDAVPKGHDRVDHLVEKNLQPAKTVCWYRAEPEIDATCTDPSREELLLGLARAQMFACDEEGMLYGEAVQSGMDCPASVAPGYRVEKVTGFVGADEYSPRNECVYETSYDTTCGGGSVFPVL